MNDLQQRAERLIAINPALAREVAKLYRVKPVGLTRRQTQALEYIRDFYSKHGVPPTQDEVAEALGNSKTAAHKLVHRLEARGHVQMLSNRSRSIVLVEQVAA